MNILATEDKNIHQITAARKDIYLVLVYELSSQSMMFVTNKEIHSNDDLVRVARLYFSRWKFEEYFWCKKGLAITAI